MEKKKEIKKENQGLHKMKKHIHSKMMTRKNQVVHEGLIRKRF